MLAGALFAACGGGGSSTTSPKGGVCAQVPGDVPDYAVIDVYSGRTGQGAARVHLRSGQLVGLERPEDQSLPPKEAGR